MGAMEVGLAFQGLRLEIAERILLSSPELANGAPFECELGSSPGEQLLLAIVRLAPGSDPRIAERLRFWCARAGGRTISLAEAPGRERDLWASRLARCSSRIRLHSHSALAGALQALRGDGASGASAAAGDGLVLGMDLGGPGSEGVAYNAEEGLLFIPAALSPPSGDEFDLMVRVRGSARPLRSRVRVVGVRPPKAAAPGAPAGFVLKLGSEPIALADALEGCCGWMNTDAMVVEARRAAPRYSVRAPAEIEIAGSTPAGLEGPGAIGANSSATAHIVNLSVGGAFIETSRPWPAGAAIRLQVRLDEAEAFETAASVVFTSATGIGVKFHLDGPSEAHLAGIIARVSARPRRALLVDDDLLARRMLGDALAERGFEVLTASSGEAALRSLARELFSLDVLVTDLRMAGIDGDRLVDTVNVARRHVDIAIVVVSGRLEGDMAQRLLAAGADIVRDKVLGPERIAQAADDAIESRRRGLPADRSRRAREPAPIGQE